MLKTLGSRAFNPMLLPALSYSIWIDALNDEHGDIALTLRSVQDQTGLMEDSLQQKRIAEDVVNFDSVHRALIVACLPDEWYLRLRCEFWSGNRRGSWKSRQLLCRHSELQVRRGEKLRRP